ncbi:MAG TPA: fibronectin type III domain-containing protein [Candidatus Dormibacteraeota bacterium]|nr:fibronectin type III domain-containing protein [Candidatus Dormibacteraeota bacterium]
MSEGRAGGWVTAVGFAALAAVAAASIVLGGARTVQAAAPAAPAAPVALAGEGVAWVYWTAPEAGITGYTIQATPGGATVGVSGSSLSVDFTGLTDGTAYSFTVSASNGVTGPPSPPSAAVVPGLGAYHPLTPARILDTRSTSRLAAAATRDVAVAGQGGVPSSGATAAVLNVTATGTTAAGYLAVWPAGTPRPATSNLNWSAGKTVANLVEVAIGSGGAVSVFNALGGADVVIDVEGYVETPVASPPAAGLYNPLVPSRVLDTRIGLGSGQAQLCAGQTITVTIAGHGGVPASGVSAVVLNVTATKTVVAPSAWTVYPAGASRPLASNLNFVPGQTVANRVIVALGTGGAVSWYNLFGHADVVADVSGWFTDGTGATTGSRFVGIPPARLLDTRTGAALGHGVPLVLAVAGHGGVPATGATVPATAVVLNVTVTNPTAASYLTVWPAGSAMPGTSDLNYVAGLTVANLVVVKLGTAGSIDLFSAAGTTDVVVDVVGWYG